MAEEVAKEDLAVEEQAAQGKRTEDHEGRGIEDAQVVRPRDLVDGQPQESRNEQLGRGDQDETDDPAGGRRPVGADECRDPPHDRSAGEARRRASATMRPAAPGCTRSRLRSESAIAVRPDSLPSTSAIAPATSPGCSSPIHSGATAYPARLLGMARNRSFRR